MALQTDSNMQRMQEEAMRRMRELHSRARPAETNDSSREEQQPEKTEQPHQETSCPAAETSAQKPQGLMDVLTRDKDRTIILALVLLLGSDPGKSSPDLLLALLFLLM